MCCNPNTQTLRQVCLEAGCCFILKVCTTCTCIYMSLLHQSLRMFAPPFACYRKKEGQMCCRFLCGPIHSELMRYLVTLKHIYQKWSTLCCKYSNGVLHGILPTFVQVVEHVSDMEHQFEGKHQSSKTSCPQNSTCDATDGNNEGLGQPKEENEVEWNPCKVYLLPTAYEHVVNSVICYRKWIHRPQTARRPQIAHRQTQIHQKGNLFWNPLLGQKKECNCQGMMWLHHSYQKERVPIPSSPNHRQMLRYLITTKHIFQWCSTLCYTCK